MIYFLALLVMLLSAGTSSARIIHVPGDVELIQTAIDQSEAGDTVLVARGIYAGRINFGGKAITVASNFLLTEDPQDIDSTIIRGGGGGSVFRFDHGETDSSRLIGFTLWDGVGSRDLDGALCGGGIHCLDSSPYLAYLKITRCWASVGAGIFIQRCSPTVTDCEIFGNEAGQSGGGIYCSRVGANPTITRTSIHHNSTNTWGQALGCYNGARPTLINCTLTGADSSGGHNGIIAAYHDNYIRLINCVVYADRLGNLGWDGGRDTLEATWTCFSSNRDNFVLRGGVLIWGEGNIEGDPLFADFPAGNVTPGWANYPVEDSTKSPLIDSGDPDLPNDPDGTRADIGAVPFGQGGNISGVVRSALTGAPIVGAVVSGPGSFHYTTGDDGAYILRNLPSGRVTMTASASGYLDSTLAPIDVGFRDTLTQDIALLCGVFNLSGDTLFHSVRESDSTQTAFRIENHGDGRFEFTAEARPAGVFGAEPGTLLWQRSLAGIGNVRFYDPAFVNGEYYVPVHNNDDSLNSIFAFDREGRLVRSFRQPHTSVRYGVRSLAWDGEKFWGVASDTTIFAFSSAGDSITAIHTPHNNNNYNIAWDADDSLLWYAGGTTRIYAINPFTGEDVGPVQRPARLNGFSFHNDDPDGYELYCMTRPTFGNGPNSILKLDVERGDALMISTFDESVSYTGCFLTTDFDRYHNLVAVTTALRDHEYFLEVVQVERNSKWAVVSPAEGAIFPGESLDLTLSFNAAGLVSDLYPGEVHFFHNGLGLHSVVPFTLQVTPLAVSEAPLTPYALHLASPYPNPFNSTTTITFGLDKSSRTRLAVFDIQGRLVQELWTGRGINGRDARSTGEHKVVWDASSVGAGVYIMQLESGGKTASVKAVVVR